MFLLVASRAASQTKDKLVVNQLSTDPDYVRFILHFYYHTTNQL